MKDHLEDAIEKALTDAEIVFTTNQRLDFHLTEYDVYIEVKQYHSDRANKQLKSQEEVILIQGKKSVALFCELLKKSI